MEVGDGDGHDRALRDKIAPEGRVARGDAGGEGEGGVEAQRFLDAEVQVREARGHPGGRALFGVAQVEALELLQHAGVDAGVGDDLF